MKVRSTLPIVVLLCAFLSHRPAQSQSFDKSRGQYCLEALSAEEQGKRFARILNLGASYSHGCTGCDASDAVRAYLELTDDSFWIRRNPLLNFLLYAPWKNKDEFRAEFVSVVENDSQFGLVQTLPQWQTQLGRYDGRWVYDHHRDLIALMDRPTLQRLLSQPGFVDDASVIGGANPRTRGEPLASSMSGHLYQTFPGKFGEEGAKSKVIIDFAIDGGRMHDVFRYYSDGAVYKKLTDDGWRDPALRQRAIDLVVARLQATNPSIVLGVDILFWDAIAHTYSLMRQQNPQSLVVRFLTWALSLTPRGRDYFDETKRTNVTDDFYEVLRRLSVGDSAHPPVPILLSRLLDEPARYFSRASYEPVIGALFGQAFQGVTGRNFAEEITDWLRKIGYDDKPTPSALTSPATHLPWLNPLPSGQSLAQVNASSLPFRTDPIGETSLASVPAFMRGLANWAIMNMLGDIPLALRSLDRAFADANSRIREFTNRPDNNVHLINMDEFYQRFPSYLKPESAHPSVGGSRLLAKTFLNGICSTQD